MLFILYTIYSPLVNSVEKKTMFKRGGGVIIFKEKIHLVISKLIFTLMLATYCTVYTNFHLSMEELC